MWPHPIDFFCTTEKLHENVVVESHIHVSRGFCCYTIEFCWPTLLCYRVPNAKLGWQSSTILEMYGMEGHICHEILAPHDGDDVDGMI